MTYKAKDPKNKNFIVIEFVVYNSYNSNFVR